MALQRQKIPISFAGGIDTKTDDKQVVPTKLLQLENGIFTKFGQIRKRYGYNILKKDIIGEDDTISEATGVATFKSELVLFTGIKLYSFIEASQAWTEKGTASSVTISNKSIIRNIYEQLDADYAHNQGIGCYVWKDSSGGSRYSVVDEESGNILVENQLLSSTGITPKVVGTGQYIFIYYIESQTIKFRYVQVSTPHLISLAIDLTTTVDPTNKIYDVQKIGDRAYIAYNTNNPSGSIALFYMNPAKTISSEVNFIGEEAVGGISITSDISDNIWLFWASSTEVNYLIRDYSTDNSVLAVTLIETISNVRNISACLTDVTENTVLYEVTNSPDNFIKKNVVSLVGIVGTPEVFLRSVGLASKFFTYNNECYVTVVTGSELQSTYFVYSLNSDIITKINNNIAGGYTNVSALPNVIETSTGKFTIPTLKKGTLQAEDGILFTSIGVNSSVIDFVSLNNFITAELGNNLHVVGGLLQSYDGASVTETGFNVFPEGVTSLLVSPGTGNLPNGNYQYAVVYAWYDNQGQLHRSAPSIPLEVVVSGGPSNVQLTIPTLRLSKKENVFIEVYRTEVNSTLFYKVTSNTSLTLNDPTVDTIVYVDNKTDAQLISGEILYTTGGVLENIAPPSSSVVVNWKNRLVVKSSDEENTLWYSKIRNEGGPVEFNDSLKILVDPIGGDITALGVLDDKLVIFKESSLHMLAGDGPNNLGEQSDFGLPQLITADAGCVDVNSVVQTPVGLMFKSKKGIYLLNRGLAASYIGAEVEEFNDSRITASKLVPDVNQIRFTTEDNMCLVFDYFFQQWSTFTNHEAVGATIYQDKFTFIKSDARVFMENQDVFTDGAQSVKLRLVSSWIQIANVQGFQRVYKLLLLGQYKSKHRLKVKIGFDFNSSFIQETEIDVFDVLDPTTYGEDSPYGYPLGEPYGGEYPLYEWRIFPKRQKCQSIRISIEDIMDDVFGESFNISNMRFEVGIKESSNKLGTSRSYGAS